MPRMYIPPEEYGLPSEYVPRGEELRRIRIGEVLAPPRKSRVETLKVGRKGRSTEIIQIVVHRPTIAPSAVAANTVEGQTFTVAGVDISDTVEVNPGINTILVSGAYVSAKDTLTVIFGNPTASQISPASSVWLVKATRS